MSRLYFVVYKQKHIRESTIEIHKVGSFPTLQDALDFIEQQDDEWGYSVEPNCI